MFKMNQFSYSSKLFNTEPKEKIIFGMSVLCICLILNSMWVSSIVIVIMGIITITNSKISICDYIKKLSIPIVFLLLGTIMIVIVREELNGSKMFFGIDIFGSKYGITKKSLIQGGGIILKSLGSISCMYFIILNTTMCDLLKGLRDLKIPKLIISLMELMYRYIFVIIEEANRMNIARRARLGDTSFYRNIKSLGELCGTLFLKTFLKGNRIYSALESRGYDGELRSLDKKYETKKLYVASFFLSCGLLIVKILEGKIK